MEHQNSHALSFWGDEIVTQEHISQPLFDNQIVNSGNFSDNITLKHQVSISELVSASNIGANDSFTATTSKKINSCTTLGNDSSDISISGSIDFHANKNTNRKFMDSKKSSTNHPNTASIGNACCFCSRHFLSIHQLYEHVKGHFEEDHNIKCQSLSKKILVQPFSDGCIVCIFCDQNFEDPEVLKNHENTHLQGLLLQCGQCEKKFINSDKLNTHYQSSKVVKLCELCCKYFSNSEKYATHLCFYAGENLEKSCSDEYNVENPDMFVHKEFHLSDGNEDTQDYDEESVKAKNNSKQLIPCDNMAFKQDIESDEKRDVETPTSQTVSIAHINRTTCPDPREYRCIKCDKKFKRLSTYKCHKLLLDCRKSGTSDVAKRNGEEKNICHICEKSFKSDKHLKQHMLLHSENDLKCLECNKIFKFKSSLLNHLKKRRNCYKPIKCGKCDETFRFHKQLDDHVKKQHPGEKLFKCPICEKGYTQKVFLRKHFKRHIEAGLYKCKFCDKCFNGKDSLVIHERVHTGENPYMCDVCAKSYKTASALSHHKKFHTGEKPYVCKVCNQTFRQLSSLKYHELKHIPKEERPRHQCDICGKSYSEYGSLSKHLKYHTEGYIFKCDDCQKSFATKARLENHNRSRHSQEKPFECSICQKRFSRSDSLNTHKIIHTGLKPFKCDYCEKSFCRKAGKTNHERIHTGERPYMCNICGLWLITSSALHSHMKTHKSLRHS